MSTLIYNCIKIDVLQTVRYSRTPIFDGRTYQYTRHFIHVKGVINPAATAYFFSPAPTANVNGDGVNPGNKANGRRGVQATPGINPSGSDYAIRHLLSQPRCKLLYASGEFDANGNAAVRGFNGALQDTLILEAPPAGGNNAYTTDADYGPFPLKFDVWRIDGTETFRVEFAIETFVNESHLFLLKPPILLSNEWEMDHDIDEHGFTAQHVRGRAKFRADVLESLQTSPDDYRDFLLLPIPAGFQRKALRVRAGDDGTTIYYQFTDQQVSHSYFAIQGYHFTKIEAFATLRQGTFNTLDLGARNVGTSLSGIGSFLRADIAGVVGAATKLVTDKIDALPTLDVSVTVRMWGSPYSGRTESLRLADWIVNSKLPDLFNDNKIYLDTRTEINVDLLGRFVEVTKGYKLGGRGKMVGNLGILLKDFPDLTDEDDIIIPRSFTGLPQDTPVASAGLIQGLDIDLPDRRWLPGTAARPEFQRLCVASALADWQNGPQVPPVAQRLAGDKVTPNY